MNRQLTLFGEEKTGDGITNVSSVPQRSPFRYPGGKTWLVPVVRQWLAHCGGKSAELIEPFAGGGIVSLTAVFEDLTSHVTMVEKDEEVAAVWKIMLNGKNKWLAEKVATYELTIDNVKEELNRSDKQLHDVAFCTILRNRISHGGILAKGSGILNKGENGRGIASRWYPKTLHDRIVSIGKVRGKITFILGDAFETLEKNKGNRNACFFIDPPYTVAGRRLYTYSEIDHERLFSLVSNLQGHFMLTYDNTLEIRKLAEKYNFSYKTIPMKTTHHQAKEEIIISDDRFWN